MMGVSLAVQGLLWCLAWGAAFVVAAVVIVVLIGRAERARNVLIERCVSRHPAGQETP